MCLGALGTITRRWDEGGIPMASVRFADREDTVCLAYLPEAAVGDHLVVHLGFGLEILSPEEAQEAVQLRAGLAADGEAEATSPPRTARTVPEADEPAAPL